MARQVVTPPQTLADDHALAAQRYAGYLVGHPYRNPQMQPVVEIDRRRPWKEPAIVADECIFCVRLTDDEADRRITGFQYRIDIEATRGKRKHFQIWVGEGSANVPEPGLTEPGTDPTRFAVNLRRFCELFQDKVTDKRPNGWRTRPLPLVWLPLRLKRKLCIEWNHLYVAWMKDVGVEYDFERREFYRTVEGDGSGMYGIIDEGPIG